MVRALRSLVPDVWARVRLITRAIRFLLQFTDMILLVANWSVCDVVATGSLHNLLRGGVTVSGTGRCGCALRRMTAMCGEVALMCCAALRQVFWVRLCDGGGAASGLQHCLAKEKEGHDAAWRGSKRVTTLLGEGVRGSRRCLAGSKRLTTLLGGEALGSLHCLSKGVKRFCTHQLRRYDWTGGDAAVES